jgi:purine-binding chemotaxis protein CheW
MSELTTAPEEITRILRERARVLACPPQSQLTANGVIEIIEFGLDLECYALETRFVKEVLLLEHLTPLPGTPPFLAGLINVRGRILAIINIKKFFDLPDKGITDVHQVLLVRTGGMEFGILADLVNGVRSIALETLQASLPTLTGVREAYLRGVTAERLVVLDAERIAADPRILVEDSTED